MLFFWTQISPYRVQAATSIHVDVGGWLAGWLDEMHGLHKKRRSTRFASGRSRSLASDKHPSPSKIFGKG